MLQAVDLGLDDPQRMGFVRHRRRAQVGAEVEQVVLYPAQHGVAGRVGMLTREPHGGVGFIDGAVSADTSPVFFDPLAVTKRCFTLVTTARVDFGKLHHVRKLPRALTRKP